MNITLDHDDLRPLIQSIVDETLDHIDAAQSRLPISQLAYTEAEAAGLIGVAPHSLRDARLRGEIKASRLGKRILYQRSELLKFLSKQQLNP